MQDEISWNDNFLIVDKETKKFMKVKVSDCEVLEY